MWTLGFPLKRSSTAELLTTVDRDRLSTQKLIYYELKLPQRVRPTNLGSATPDDLVQPEPVPVCALNASQQLHAVKLCLPCK